MSLSRVPRVYVEDVLAAGREVALTRPQCHYLVTVMRLRPQAPVRLFNGRDGEWLCHLREAGRKRCSAVCEERIAAPAPPPDIDYLFAPLKAARLDYMAQKATEMGVRRLRPVFTDHTVPSRVNLDRLRANAVEAAEQCNLVFVPEVHEARPLAQVLEDWDPARRIIYCDEAAPAEGPLAALESLPPGPLAVLIGPEGGFSERERRHLRSLTFVHPISLGPRIMRADTAAVAALALVQATLGDWRGPALSATDATGPQTHDPAPKS